MKLEIPGNLLVGLVIGGFLGTTCASVHDDVRAGCRSVVESTTGLNLANQTCSGELVSTIQDRQIQCLCPEEIMTMVDESSDNPSCECPVGYTKIRIHEQVHCVCPEGLVDYRMTETGQAFCICPSENGTVIFPDNDGNCSN